MTSQTLPINIDVDPIIALKQLYEKHPEQVVFTTSLGLDYQSLTYLITRNNIGVKLVTLDTGRLFPETYSLLDRTRAKYGLDIKSYFPDTLSLE